MIAHYESEQCVLGAMLRSEKAAGLAVERLRPEDFADPAHREIFSALLTLTLSGKRADMVTLDAELTRRGKLDFIGGAGKIAQCYSSTPSAANVEAYIKIVLEKSNLRRLLAVAESIRRRAENGEKSADEIIELVEGECGDITARAAQRDAGWITANDAALMAFDAAEKPQPAIPTGFTELDGVLCGGLTKPELTIVGARPGKGKSAFLMAAAMNAARNGKQVGYFSLEMSALQIGQRMLASTSLVSITRQRNGDMQDTDWERINDALTVIDGDGIGSHLHIYQSYGLTIERLGNVARHAVRRGEMDLLVLDYLQLLRTAERTTAEFERVGAISKGLKQLALALDIPILTAAQVRRQSADDTRKGGRAPTLDELRGSGDLEQDADNVLLIHTPETQDDATLAHIASEHTGIWDRAQTAFAKPFTVEVAKQRQGATRRTWCLFKPMNMRFMEDKR